jgi:hypothetical protein
MTLEEWFLKNLPGLKKDLTTNLEGIEVPEEDRQGLLRVMMISIREHVIKRDRAAYSFTHN